MSTLTVFDPGQITGFACFTIAEDGSKAQLTSSGDFFLWDRVDELLVLLPEILLYEKIVARHPTFNPAGMYTIGVILFLAGKYHLRPISRAPQFLTAVRKRVVLSQHSQHARDAIHHGISYISQMLPKCTIAVKEV